MKPARKGNSLLLTDSVVLPNEHAVETVTDTVKILNIGTCMSEQTV